MLKQFIQAMGSWLKILDWCDFARFAPGSSSVEEMKDFLKQAEKAIAELED